ncbi:SRPBCC family protein [Brevifollis gellanilyticus]|uniref:Polyketide cyclase n=1 Tax=Brevifollis gellanilyticus TaxID=748831 RepID=A0A512MF27_9BACT|nr:SRPBCC family protein [Brevifollis gellanilyticus]GEP45306.1 polyketide cyclase [Brevifollis gellanilyticus]
MIKKILLTLMAIIGVILIAASFQSDDMNVSRSATINAAPEAVYKVVSDFRQWDAWSPWSKLDPEMKKSIDIKPEGVGSVYKWSGNSEVGEGSTTLVEAKPNEKVGMRLEFVRPMEGSSDVQFTFVPEAAGTKVTWSMQSKKPFIGKVAGLFMDCEKMCGDQFSEGLNNLAKVVASAPAPAVASEIPPVPAPPGPATPATANP